LLLTMPVADGLARAVERGERDRMERAELAFHERVALAFETFTTSDWQAAHPECGPIVLVDATGSEAAVFDRVLGTLRTRWPGTFPVAS
jgi:thymidylate kinase